MKHVDAGAVAELRSAVDVVVPRDGRVEEGTRNGHGPSRLQLPNRAFDAAPANPYLAELYDGGARRMLIVGNSPIADALLSDDLLDQIIADLPRHDAMPPPDDSARPALPAGFATVNISGTANGVRLTGNRSINDLSLGS